MSGRHFGIEHFGLLIRQNEDTGVLEGPVWCGDEVTDLQISRPGQVATHPVQSGRIGPSDVRIEQPAPISVTWRITRYPPPSHPRQDWGTTFNSNPDRVETSLREIEELEDEGAPLACLFRGGDLRRDYVIESLNVSLPLDRSEASVSATLVPVRIATLRAVPVEQDGDLLALGSQVAATIGVFGA